MSNNFARQNQSTGQVPLCIFHRAGQSNPWFSSGMAWRWEIRPNGT